MAGLEEPTKNIQFLLYALSKLQPAKGRIQLYKIHYLIEKEGHVKYDMPIDQYPLGPVDYASINFCTENGLLSEVQESVLSYTRYSIYLTPTGKEYFDNECLPKMSAVEIKKADKVIDRYKGKTGKEILEHVHKNYVDGFVDSSKIKVAIDGFQKYIPVEMNLVQKNIEKEPHEVEGLTFAVLGYLEHLNEILNSMKTVKDAVKRGQVLSTIQDVFSSLQENGHMPTPYAMELLDYLDSYCEKEKICKSMISEDFSDIPEGERKRLAKSIQELQIPPSS